MMLNRLGACAVLTLGGVTAPLHQIAHQGKYTERPLEARLTASTPIVDRLHLTPPLRANRTATFRSLRRLVTPAQWRDVWRVHQCEQPASWHVHGPTYWGGLGWLMATWQTYRASWMPARMDEATPQEQAWAMVQFVGRTLHYWPDATYPASCGMGY